MKRDIPGKKDAIKNTELFRNGKHLLKVFSRTPEYNQWQPRCLWDQGERLDHHKQVLPLLYGAYAQDIVIGQGIFFSDGLDLRGVKLAPEIRMRSLVNNLDLGRLYIEKLLQIRLCLSADGNDLVRIVAGKPQLLFIDGNINGFIKFRVAVEDQVMHCDDLPDISWQVDRKFLAQPMKYSELVNTRFPADTPRAPNTCCAEELVPFTRRDNADVALFQNVRRIRVRRIPRCVQIVRVLGKITA